MRKAWIKRNRKIISGIFIFSVIFGIVGILMYNKMRTLLNYYVERQTAQQAEVLAQTTEKQFAAELRQLTWTADYIQYHEAERQDIVNTFADHEDKVSVGLLEMDGNAVCGEALDFLAFDGIRQSFRGEDAVSYSKERGLLFTVPVYRGRNVRYVLYKLYDTSLLYNKFGLSCHGGKGRVLIMDLQEQVIISSGNTAEDAAFFNMTEIYDGYLTMREQLQVLTSTSTHVETERESYFLFSAEIDDTDLILVGYVPEDVAMEGISYLVVLALWVFGLLMVVLVIGMVYLFGAEEKARESDELREAKLMADKANRAKSDFLANMSHEIRTPINAVMGMNEMILRECEQEDIREYAQNIQGASQTLLSLINDILDFSKIESGKMEIVEAAYDTASMLNDVINMVRVKADSKNLQFNVDIDEKLPSELWGDGTRDRQVIINILNNAVKYTKEGQVSLSVNGERSGADKILLEIRVSDTGIGIKEEDMPKLFRNFERLNLGENRNVEGTGLGLAITYRLVEQMNGRIEVESQYGVGSTFTIYLQQGIVNDSPLGDFQERYQLAMKRSRHQYRESFAAPDAKILVVDDTAMNLLVIEQLLKKTRVQVDTCLSGNACLELVQREHYDVILLDHMMPDMDGIETLKMLKDMKNNRCQDTPVIALTANAIVGVREMYIENGFDDYLSKPVEGNDLETMLKQYIPSEKMQIISETEQQIPVQSGQQNIKSDGDNADDVLQSMPPTAELKWLDIDMGLRYCGDSEEVYREVLQEFCDVEQTECCKIENAYERGDWKNYAILVHGLKSSSLSAGAKKLSDEAAGLEKSSREMQKEDALHKEEILAYIREYHGKMMELYRDSSNEGRRYLQS
ncbi:MAG: response regulator [Lachnospiraceae bacterium]|nr:response regulator [Lachnospiraceae bacterium]